MAYHGVGIKALWRNSRRNSGKMTQQQASQATTDSIAVNDSIDKGYYAYHNKYKTSKMKQSSSSTPVLIAKCMLCSVGIFSRGISAFTPPLGHQTYSRNINAARPISQIVVSQQDHQSSSTALNVWWFGGTPGTSSETSMSGEECELVAVRIDRTSANSRRIAGEIVVDATLMDVWAILTDYDNLSTHVPNLVASKRVSNQGGMNGDGTHECRLYQRGAQKIIGFEFGADVTMDMTESIVVAGKSGKVTKSDDTDEEGATTSPGMFPEERRIGFKCVDSQFFSEFDGTWRVVQMPDNPFTGQPETTVSYTVEVRPKGPVPVGALEWRIREDVPTNLRAVKKAAIEVGYEGVHGGEKGAIGKVLAKLTGSSKSDPHDDNMESMDFADFILDYENETLGAYLD